MEREIRLHPQPRNMMANVYSADIDNTSNPSDIEEDQEQISSIANASSAKTQLFSYAASGDVDNLKKILNSDGGLIPAVISATVSNVLSKDQTNKGRNILHLAAGFQGDPASANECVVVILRFARKYLLDSDYESLVNCADDDGATALYLAAKYENMDASRTLVGGGSDLDQANSRGKTPIMKLFKKMPSVLAEIFEKNGKTSHFVDGDRQTIKLQLRSLISVPMETDILKRSPGLYREMDLLSNLSYTPLCERAQVLENTHVKTLVWIKWQYYKWIFWAARCFQISWFLLYVAYLLSLYRFQCPFPVGKIYNFSWIVQQPSSSYFNYPTSAPVLLSERGCATFRWKVVGWVLMFSAVVDAILIEGYPTVVRFRRKWYPMKRRCLRKYVKQSLTFLKILHLEKAALLLSIFLNTIPINLNIDIVRIQWQYVFAALGIFLACYHIFLQLGKFPSLKGYIKMFTKTLNTLCIVIILYGTLIFAFAMSFCILLPGEISYSSPFEAIIRVFTFTIGEVDFEDTFYGEDASAQASFLVTSLFYGVAIIVLHIALLNFLIGLTINELQNLWKQADLWKTYTYLWQIYLCETFISNFPFRICQRFLYQRMVLKCKYVKVADLEKQSRKQFYKTRMDKLPKSIRKEIRQLNLPWLPSTNTILQIDTYH